MLLVLLLIATAITVVTQPTSRVEAATVRAFSIRKQFNINGAIDTFGNTLMTCSGATCTNAVQNPALTSTASLINNNFSMVNVDADGAAFTTTNSSMATVTYPAGATVRFAGLYWGAESALSTRNTASFRRPGDAAYSTVTASQLDVNGNAYQAFTDVTASVAATGPGQYWLGNVKNTLATNQYAGWSLVVVWEDSSQPLRNLTVFDGYGIVQNTTADRTITIPLSGFLAPPFGPVVAEVGAIAYEGDRGTVGDAFQLNGTALTDAANPANDFFNSTVSSGGTIDGGRDPSYVNTLGYDADEVDATGIIPNSATTATVTLTTAGDTYYPGVVTTQIGLYAPAFPTITKSVVDLNGGEVRPGDALEYTIGLSNVGLDPALNNVMTDALPNNVTFVPGSISIVSGPGAGPKSDGPNDDQAEYSSRTVTVRVGTGANATTGGTLNPNESTTLKFRVTIDAAAAAGNGSTIGNRYSLAYVAKTLNQPFSFVSNLAEVIVPPLADVALTKSVAASPMTAGVATSYTLTATNTGPGTAQDVTITDTLPTGLTVVTPLPTGCSGTTTITCSAGAIASGANAAFTIGVLPGAGLASGSTVTNSASVTSTTTDLVPGNNSATISASVATQADLAVTKSVAPSPLVAGSPATYTITATNAGPSNATSASITDTLPSGVTTAGAPTTNAGTCTTMATTVTCSPGNIAAGGTVTITVPVAVAPGSTGTANNQVTISSATPDPTPANNTFSLVSPVTSSADLSVVKSILTAPVTAGSPVVFRAIVTNNGPSAAAGVVLTDPMPAGFTATGASTTVGSCTVTVGNVSCPIGSLTPGGAATVTITATPAASIPNGTNFSNTATVASTTTDPASANNSSTASGSVTATSNLTLTKSASPNPVVAGTNVTYTLVVTNTGPSVATAVQVVDSLPNTAPNTLTFVAAGSSGSCSASGATVTCPVGALSVGASSTVTVVAAVPAGSTGAFTNTATATSPQASSPASASVQTNAAGLADISVTKTAAGPVIAGQSATFSIVVRNNGPSDAAGVTVADALPAGFTALSINAPGATCTLATVSCTAANLSANASYTITVVAAVSAETASGGAANNATVTASTPSDGNASNNTGTATIQVNRSADLVAAKSASPTTVTAGNLITFTLSATNNGPSTAEIVQAADTLGAGLSFVSAGSSTGCTAIGQQVTCSTTTPLNPTETQQFTVVARVASSVAAGQVTNSVAVSSTTPDANATNNAASTSFAVATDASLSITKSVVTNPVVAGKPVTWNITITNDGPSDARAVTLSDPSPSSPQIRWTAAVPSVGSCTIAGGTTDVACSVGTIGAGSSVVVTVTGDLAANATGAATNTATASSPTDATPNSITATAPVVVSSDLVVTKRTSPDPIVAGSPVTWVITTTNNGPSVATGVVVTDAIPAGTTLQSASSTVGTCSGTTTVNCAIGSLANGASATVTIVATTPPSTTPGSTISNTASATSATTDPVTTNNSATSSATVTGVADLLIAKSAASDVFVAGGAARWVISVVNNGPSDAANTVVTDPIPAGISAVGAVTNVGGCTVTTSVVCTLGTLKPGDIVAITVSGQLSPTALDASNLANTASVGSDASDPDPASNTSTSVTQVQTVADLTATKTASPSPANAGEDVTWSIVVTNVGPSVSRNVVVSDAVPAGVTSVSSTWSNGGPATNCATTPASFTCNLATLGVNGSATVTFVGTLSASYSAATVVNTATISTSTPQPDASPFTVSSTTPVNTPADVRISKSGPSVADVGLTISWSISVTNDGPAVARNVRMSDPVPSGIAVSSATTPTPGGCTLSPAVTNCTFGDLAVGQSRVVTIIGSIDSGFTGPSISNTATVVANNVDPDPSDNSATAVSTTQAIADLSITKTAPPTATAGGLISWTVTVDNAGPATARSVVVTDAIPSSVDPTTVNATTNVGTCSTGANVSCSLDDVGVSAAPVIIILTGVIRADQLGVSISNTATVSSATGDDDSGNNSATAITALQTRADLTITKVLDTTTPVAGLPAKWTVTVTNNGPSTARQVVVTDDPPFVLDSVSTTLGSCTADPAECAVGDLPSGATVAITLQGVIPAGFTGSMTNAATVSSSTSDPVADNTASVTSLVQTSADLSIVKAASDPNATAGEPLAYTITVTNDGPSVARAPSISDTLPTSFVPGPAPAGCVISAGTLTCTLSDLAPNASDTVTVDGQLSSTAPSTVTNTASVQSVTPDPSTGNNSSTTIVSPTIVADLDLIKTLLTADPVAGAPIEWSIAVTNRGPSLASPLADDIVVSDPAPAGTVITGVVDPTGGFVCTSTAVGATCSVPQLDVGETATATVQAIVEPDFPAGPLVNTATITSGNADDPTIANDSDQVIATVRREAALTVTKTVDAPTAVAGTDVTWTVEVANTGPSSAEATVVTDALPAGVTFVSSPQGCTAVGNLVGCPPVLIQPATAATFQIVVHIDAGAPAGVIVNTATASSVTPGTSVPGIAQVDVSRLTSATITKTSSPSTADAGTDVRWTITVTNSGPSTLVDPVVADLLDPVLTYRSATPSSGSCDFTTELTCSLATMAVGEIATIDLVTATASATPPGSLANSATLTGGTPFAPSSNLTGAGTVDITASADLVISKSALTTPIVPGRAASWLITVRNLGPSDAFGVVISDVAPPGVQFTAANSATVGGCVVALDGVTCSAPVIAAGSTHTITVTGDVASDVTAASIVNTTSLTSATRDPVATNNTGSVATPVRPIADVSIDKVGPTTITAGLPATWTITVTNGGPSVAVGTTVSDTLPDVIDPATVVTTTSAGSCTGAPSVSCTISTLEPLDVVTITITGTVRSNTLAASMSNSATVASQTADDDLTDNADSATTTITTSADLIVTKQADTSPLIAGRPVRWTIRVANNGPSTARAVVLDESPPFTLDDVSPSQGSCSTSSCQLGDLAAGATATIVVNAVVPASFTGDAINNVEASSDTTDPAPNNSATTTDTVTTLADLAVTKTSSDPTAVAGGPLTYTITVSNTGPSVAVAPSITDDLPQAFVPSASTFSGSGYQCSISPGNQLTCTLDDDLSPGTAIAITVPGDIDPGNTASFANTAAASSATPDPNPLNDGGTAINDPSIVADVSLSKTVLTADPVAGRPLRWSIVLSNAGPSTASAGPGSIVFEDVAPAGTVFIASSAIVSSGAASCSASSTVVSCAIDELAVGASVTVVLEALVSPATAGGPVANTVSITAGLQGDPSSANDTASAVVNVRRQADLSVAKTVTPSTVAAGETAVFTIAVTNSGPSTAESAIITDALPAGLTLLPATTSPECALAAGTVVCEAGTLAVGATRSFDIAVTVDPSFAGPSITNTATPSSTTPGSVVAGSATLGVTRLAAARITKTAITDPVVAGRPMSWLITVYNDGPSVMVAPRVVDTIDASRLSYTSAVPSSGNCIFTTPTLTCNLADLLPGAVTTVRVTTGVLASAPDGAVDNTATLSTITPTTSSSTLTATASPTITTSADIAVDKVPTASPAVPGQNVAWDITVINNGPSDARSVVVTDPAPAGVTLTSADSDTLSGCSVAGNELSCSIPTLATGASHIVRLVGALAPDAQGPTLANTVFVTAATDDPSQADNELTASTPVQPRADLAIVKTGPPVAVAGNTITWTIAVTNNGPSTAVGAVLADQLPPEVDASTATVNPAAGCTLAASLSCQLGDIAPGETVTRVLAATVRDDTTSASVANTASVASVTPDPNPADNTQTSTTTVAASANVTITKVVDTIAPVAGQPVQWTIVVGNVGPSVARGVTVIDTVPFSISSMSSTLGTCIAGTTTCAIGDLAVGDEARITVGATIPVDFVTGSTGPLSNTAAATSTTPDPSVPNEATATTTVATSADLVIVKTSDSPNAVSGTPLTYTIQVTNRGPSTARAAEIADSLPARFVPSSNTSTGPGYDCNVDVANDLSCTLDDLPPNATVSVMIPGAIDASSTQPFTNTASVESVVTPDPDTADNSSTAINDSAIVADLAVTKTVSTGDPVAGQPIRWEIVVTNNGPSTASAGPGSITVNDTAPTGTTFGAGAVLSATPGVSCVNTPTAVDCSIDQLAVGANFTVELEADIGASTQAGALANTAALTAGNDNDPTAANDAATVIANVRREAALSVDKVASATTINAGEQVAWSLTVVNSGPSTAESTTISDRLAAGLTFIAAGSSPECSAIGRQVTCLAGTLPVDPAGVSFTVVTAVDPTQPSGAVGNTATASSTTPNTATPGIGAVTVERLATATISKTSATDPITSGTRTSWSIGVDNVGPSSMAAATVTDTLDPFLTFVSAVPSSGTCTFAAPTLTCVLGDLAPGASAAITVTTDVSASAPDGTPIANTASLTSTTPFDASSIITATAQPVVAAEADLTITKTALTIPAVPGQSVAWSITVVNAGPSDAQSVEISDTAPAGITFTDAPGCALAPTTVSCLVSTLAAGTGASFTVTGSLDPAASAATLINAASVTSTTSDPTGPNSSLATVPITPIADLSIVKTRDPDTAAVAGEFVTWNIDVTNAGPSDAADVSWTDVLPPEVDSTTATVTAPTGWTCTTTTDVVCALPVMASGATTSFVVSARVRSDSVATSTTNSVSVSASTIDPDPTGNTASLTTAIVTVADLTVGKTLDTAVLIAGQPVRWTVTVRNEGPSVARSVSIVDTPPFPIDGMTSAAGTCVVSTSTCSLGDLAVGSSAVVVVTGVVPANFAAGAPGGTATVTNTASASSTTVDPTPDNAATVSGPATASADLTITKTSSAPTSVIAGTAMTYTIEVTNSGPSTAVSPTVVDALPAPFRPSSSTVSGGGYACDVDGAGVLTCALADLPPAGRVVISVPGVIAANAVDGFSNTATVSSPTPDPATDSNAATASNAVDNDADLSITKVVSSSGPTVAGRPVEWTLVVTNAGPSVAQQVVITDLLPPTIASPTATSANSTCTLASNAVTCRAEALAVGDTITIIVRGAVSASATGLSIVNTASVVAGAPDSDPSNNTATAAAPLTASADLSVSKRVVGGPFRNGDEVAFDIIVTNRGPSDAIDVDVTDDLPPGLTLVRISSEAGTCASSTASCRLPSLPAGANATITVAARATQSGQIANQASADSATPDPDRADNAATATVDIGRVATLRVTKTPDRPSVVVGGNTVWTVEIRNAGPDVADDIAVTETIPSSLVFVSASASVGTYASSDDTWRIANLANGATATLTITTRAGAVGTATNTVTARWTDAPAGPVAASAPVTVLASATIPATGSDSAVLLRIAFALLLVGGSLFAVARRRRRVLTK